MAVFLEVFADIVGLTARAQQLLVDQALQAVADRGVFTLALAGGSTPKRLYSSLSRAGLPWDRLEVFWSDERYVPPDHPDSNQAMARSAWLNQVPIPTSQVHPMPTQPADPAVAAQLYEEELRRCFSLAPAAVPQFDLILLGLGDDGHTASLFPHTPALAVRDRLVTVGAKEGQPRLTFTVPVINAAARVIFLVTGANKNPALRQVMTTGGDDQAYPARLVQPAGELWWLLDQAAAGDLTTARLT